MTDWVGRQLELLRTQWPELEYNQDGHWVLIRGWILPGGWSRERVDVAFQIKEAADQPPYAFCVSPSDLTYNAEIPQNWNATTDQVRFPGVWSQFSWAPETWTPTADPSLGPNMLAFVRSFDQRFREGA